MLARITLRAMSPKNTSLWNKEKANAEIAMLEQEIVQALRKPGRLVGSIDPSRADLIEIEVEL